MNERTDASVLYILRVRDTYTAILSVIASWSVYRSIKAGELERN